MKQGIWGLDRITFRINGRDPQRFLNLASRHGVRLSHLRREEDGLSASAPGNSRVRIEQLAVQGGWRFSLLERRGPGRLAERIAARPGLIAGGALFLMLLQCFGQLLWTIDFGGLGEEQTYRLRTLLAGYGIYEGVRMEEKTLESARQAALQQSDLFGWITLNFAGGCLFVESTEARYQELRAEVPLQALYAREAGEITAMNAESGFAAVRPGQMVEQGQMLVGSVRPDHDGDPVYQGASGEVVARVEKSYTSFQPFRQETEILTGACATQAELYVLGRSLGNGGPALETAAERIISWEPVRLGRLSLPACIRFESAWPRARRIIVHSAAQARALARRACRDALLAEFPDAVVEAETCRWQTTGEGEACTVTYRFCADIATPVPPTAANAAKN